MNKSWLLMYSDSELALWFYKWAPWSRGINVCSLLHCKLQSKEGRIIEGNFCWRWTWLLRLVVRFWKECQLFYYPPITENFEMVLTCCQNWKFLHQYTWNESRKENQTQVLRFPCEIEAGWRLEGQFLTVILLTQSKKKSEACGKMNETWMTQWTWIFTWDFQC